MANQKRFIDVRLYYLDGLPLTEPNIKIQITTDDGQEWNTAISDTYDSISYIGSWASFYSPTTKLSFKARDISPGIQCKGSFFEVAGALDVAKASIDLEAGDANAWKDAQIIMTTDGIGAARFAGRMQGVLERNAGRAVDTAQGISDAIDSKIEGLDGDDKKDATASEGSTTRTKTPVPPSDTAGASIVPDIEAPLTDAGAEEKAHLYTSDDVILHLQYRVRPGDPKFPYFAHDLSIEQEVTPLNAGLHSYAHGGFMGLAISGVKDPVWRKLLENEDPAAKDAVLKFVAQLKVKGKIDLKADAKLNAIMPILENSPVLVAMGLVRTGCTTPVNSTINSVTVPSKTTNAAGISNNTTSENTPKLIRSLTATTQNKEHPALAPETQSMVAKDEEFRTMALQIIETYKQSMQTPNRYGYLPAANEWDIWVHPHHPASIPEASINHGSAAALVMQTVTTSVPCFKGCARGLGAGQIIAHGLSPVEWLNIMGSCINSAVNGDKDKPLPLQGEVESNWKLVVSVEKIDGFHPKRWTNLYTRLDIDSPNVVIPPTKTKAIAVHDTGEQSGTLSFTDEPALTMWPLPEALKDEDLLVEVKGNPTGFVRERFLGATRVKLSQSALNHPELLKGEEVVLNDLELIREEVRLLPVNRGKWESTNENHEGDDDGKEEDHDGIEHLDSIVEDAEVAGGGTIKEVELSENPANAVTGTASSATAPTTSPRFKPFSHVEKIKMINPTKTRRRSVSIRIKLERVSVLDAAVSMGVTRSAAQSALAMLASPGGLYLDVKSAYSSAYELQLFVSVLKGIGIHTKAVCSFQPHQLEVGSIADTVLFFHGLAGLENACDNALVKLGQRVLFNGASFLLDLKESSLASLPENTTRRLLTTSKSHPLDEMAVKRYVSLCERYHVIGGIYVQEPDCSPDSLETLFELVNEYEDVFPLGFAYGHLNGRAVSFPDMKGRGFASQQIVEEIASRKDLSRKTRHRIEDGEHHAASNTTLTVWIDRLINTPGRLNMKEQRAVLMLLNVLEPLSAFQEIVEAVGGVTRLVARFHEQYEFTTPLTLLEAGFNFNYTKSLLRMLRNKGVIAAMSQEEKNALAMYLTSSKLRGWGMTWILMALSLRKGLHKHSKEGLLCLFESSTKDEVEALMMVLKGEKNVKRLLHGWWYLSFSYTRRLSAIHAIHEKDATALAYQQTDYKYAQLTEFKENSTERYRATHTRNKSLQEKAVRTVRKWSCCACTTCYATFCEIITAGLFLPCCILPRTCGNYIHGSCGFGAIISIILGFLVMCVVVVLTPTLWVPDSIEAEPV